MLIVRSSRLGKIGGPRAAAVFVAHLLSDYVSSLRHVQILNGGAGGASSFSGGSGTSITDGGSFGEDGKVMSSQETGIQDAAKPRFWRKD